MDTCMSFCTRIFVFASWSLSIPPLNRMFWFSDPVSFKQIELLTALYGDVSKGHKIHLLFTVIVNTV